MGCATRRGDRLIGALAAKIFGGAKSHDRFARPRKAIHPNYAIDCRVADHMDHLPDYPPPTSHSSA